MTWSALDLRVFILINGVMGCLMALVLYSQSRSYPKSIHGLREWATAYLLAFFATVLYGLQNTLHPLITVGLANVLLLLTGAYALAGAAALHGRVLPSWLFPALLCFSVPAFAWLSTDRTYTTTV